MNKPFHWLLSKAVFKDDVEQGLLSEYFSHQKTGFFLDIGANAPNNAVSRFLWDNWEGVVVEPIPSQAALFSGYPKLRVWEAAVTSEAEARKKVTRFWVAGKQSTLDRQHLIDTSTIVDEIVVRLVTVGTILRAEGIEKVDFLAVDVEGAEQDVLRDIDLSSLGVQLLLVEDWGRGFSLHRLLMRKGYKRVRRTGFNSWYVPEEVSFPISIAGRFQIFRKYVLSMPFRNFRKWRHSVKRRTVSL